MEKFYRLVIQNATSGKIDKEAAMQLLKEIKNVEMKSDDIAIIGLSLQFPSANNVEQYWENIRSGVDSIRRFPEGRSRDIDAYLRYTDMFGSEYDYAEGAFLEEIDKFDYEFFRLTPKEASLMDPNQRLFLQTAWRAIEDAGYGGKKIVGSKTGVYVGFATTPKDSYHRFILDVERDSLPIAVAANLSAIIPSRISYLLDLKGPSLAIDTACSSSLLAVHMACQGIRNGDCEQAIAGGLKLHLVPVADDNLLTGTEASDGRTRTFDNTSDGAGFGEGVAAVLLKPLSKALKDKDHIYAVIKGSATNQDGKSISLTAPNPAAQTEVITKAWENAGIDPATITYVETHGTGTTLGDPIEIDGLQNAFRRYTDKKQFCAISSVKPNIGHTYECAGIANLIKAVLALHHKELPRNIHFDQPNREISFVNSPVYVNTKMRKWEPPTGVPRRCGVSSFGFSGTNVHLVMEEAPTPQEEAEKAQPFHVLTLSAKSETAMRETIEQYQAFLSKQQVSLGSLCYTANTGRGHYGYRAALIFRDERELLEQVERLATASDWQANGSHELHVGFHKVVTEQLKQQDHEEEITEKTQSERTQAANKKLAEFVQAGMQDQRLLAEVCALYAIGAEVDWELLYPTGENWKSSLPTYPFEAKRCWLQIPEVRRETTAETEQYYRIGWKRQDIAGGAEQLPNGVVLVLKDTKGIGENVVATYRNANIQVVEVELGEAFAKLDDQHYVISGQAGELEQVLRDLQGQPLQQVLHLMSITEQADITSEEQLTESQVRGVYSAFELTRALARLGFEHPIDIVLVAEQVHAVSKTESRIHAEQATLFGLGQVIGLEHPNLRCRNVDIDEQLPVEHLLDELKRGQDQQVAYRQGVRYVSELQTTVVEENSAPVEIRSEGVYILTGGLGGIGLEMAKLLSAKQPVNLALINRSPMPPREQWDELLITEADGKISKRIRAIREMEANGSQIITYSADVARLAEMQPIVNELRTTYGRINGIIHGAGLPGHETIVDQDAEEFKQIFEPKVFGTWALEQLTQADELDFFVLFSSVATLFAAPRQGVYVAANAYLDAFSHSRHQQGKRALTINWSTWKETGMAADHGFNVDTIVKTLTNADAVELFERALHSNTAQTFIGELNFDNPIILLLEKSPFAIAPKIQKKLDARKSNSASKKREQTDGEVVLAGRSDGVYQEVELQLVQILGKVLGYAEINIHDNFFEMGADSMLLMKVTSEVNKIYPNKITIADIFENPAVYKLAQYIHGTEHEAPPVQAVVEPEKQKEEISDILEEMLKGNLTADQVAAALDDF